MNDIRNIGKPMIVSSGGYLLIAVSIFGLAGCAETGGIYTTHPVTASDSFENDKRLVGIWSSPFWGFFGVNFDIHFQHDEESDGMYAIFHELDGCEVSPIYTTRFDEQWFMNIDTRGSYLCTRPSESVAPESLNNFKELYQLARYQITVIPVEEILMAAARFALLEVEGIDHRSFLELKEEIEKEFGFQLQYSDLQIARHLLNRLVAFFEHLSKAEIKLAELEVLSLEPMSEQLTDRAIKTGRLAGHSCFDADQIAEVEEWTPKHATEKQVQKPIDEEIPEPAANEGDDSSSHALETIDCRDKSLVITDSAEKIRSLMLRTDESGLFPAVDERDSPHKDTKTKENVDWRSSGKAFGDLLLGSWIRLKVLDSSQDSDRRDDKV